MVSSEVALLLSFHLALVCKVCVRLRHGESGRSAHSFHCDNHEWFQVCRLEAGIRLPSEVKIV